MNLKYFLFLTCLLFILFSCQDNSEFEKDLGLTNDLTIGKINSRLSHDFCLTSYNIGAFCEVGHNTIDGDAQSYAESICEVLNLDDLDSGVINIQEAWCTEVAEAILECAGGNFTSTYNSGSGLLTLISNEIPSSETHFEEFIYESGLDHIKEKGFLVNTIELEEGCEVQIINTHLQANPGIEDELFNIVTSTFDFLFGGPFINISGNNANMPISHIRASQLGQIANFIYETEDCVPTIIGGDFNIDRDSREFGFLVDFLQTQPAELVSPSPTSNSGTILDYYVISNFDDFPFSNLETTVYNDFGCLESEIITRFNVLCFLHADLDSDGLNLDRDRDFVISSFDTEAEALEYLTNIEEGDQFFNCRIEQRNVSVCITRVDNESDHNPIRTCTTYDCDEDCQTQADPCENLICDDGYYCENGECLKFSCSFCPCESDPSICGEGFVCVNGICLPMG